MSKCGDCGSRVPALMTFRLAGLVVCQACYCRRTSGVAGLERRYRSYRGESVDRQGLYVRPNMLEVVR